MNHSAFHRGRPSALAPAAALLLALCLLAVGVQAVTDPADTAALVTGAGEVAGAAADLPVLAEANTTSTLVISEPGRYELDHDLVSSDAIGVLINSSDVLFDGMGHSITGTDANGSTGVYATGRFVASEGSSISNVTVRNLTVRHWDEGIRIGDASETVVEDVLAEQNGIGLEHGSMTGITDHHVVRDSVFRENTDTGVLLFYPNQGITVERCQVTWNGMGILTQDSGRTGAPNLVADCDISQNTGDGIALHEGLVSAVRNCTISGNGNDGVLIEHSVTTIADNQIERNGRYGVNAGDRGGSDIHGNRIEGNAIGVSAGGDWPSHVRNNVLNNTDNGFFRSNGDAGILNYTKSAGPNIIGGPYLGGNFWALPNGTGFSQTHPDADGDGFCDEPYPVTEDAVDYLPLALPNGTPPVGGDKAYFLVSTAPAGAAISLEDISGTRYLQGTTTAGPLNVTIMLTATPMRKIVATLSGYRDAVYNITQYPAKDQTVPVSLTLERVGPTPYKPLSVPGRIQAEDYNLGGQNVAYFDTTPGNTGGAYRQDDVDIETGNGITNVGWIRTGENLKYTVNVSQAGSYLVSVRVASPNSGRYVAFSVDGGRSISFLVPNTGSFETYTTATLASTFGNPWVTVTQTPTPSATGIVNQLIPVTLTAGTHVIELSFTGDGQNLDWFELAPVATPTPTPVVPAPYKPLSVPGTIQAEDYDLGGEGVAYHDTAAGNSGGAYRQDDVDVAALPGGGYAVAGIEDGEWLAFSVNGTSGPVGYLPPFGLYAASDRDGRSVELEVDGRVVGNVSIPNTGNLTAPVWVQTQLFLTDGGRAVAGPHTIRLLFHGSGQSIDRIESPFFVSFADAYAWANFTAAPTNGTAPLVVRFTDTSSEWANGWAWDFGDGQTSIEQNPVHTFQRPGVYNVSLNVREADRWIGGSYLHIWNDLSHGKTVQVTAEGTGPAAHAIPGTIQAEDYDAGGEGVAYHDTTAGNSGGAYRHDDVDIETAGGITNVGWIRNGEYLTYTAAVQDAGAYALSVRVASPNTGRSFDLSIDGVHARTIVVPNTGSFGRFATVSPTVSVPVTLAAGTHTLKLTFQGDGQNLDWIAFGAPPTPTVTSTPTPTPEAGGASFTAAPVTAPKGSAVKFTLVLAAGKTVRSAWWSFDATAHLNTWNSRAISPTFFYPAAGTFTPLVKITYTDGSTETVQRANYVRAT